MIISLSHTHKCVHPHTHTHTPGLWDIRKSFTSVISQCQILCKCTKQGKQLGTHILVSLIYPLIGFCEWELMSLKFWQRLKGSSGCVCRWIAPHKETKMTCVDGVAVLRRLGCWPQVTHLPWASTYISLWEFLVAYCLFKFIELTMITLNLNT